MKNRITFQLSQNVIGGQIVELRLDGRTIATIVPAGQRTVRIMTKALTLPIRTMGMVDGITGVEIEFNPKG